MHICIYFHFPHLPNVTSDFCLNWYILCYYYIKLFTAEPSSTLGDCCVAYPVMPYISALILCHSPCLCSAPVTLMFFLFLKQLAYSCLRAFTLPLLASVVYVVDSLTSLKFIHHPHAPLPLRDSFLHFIKFILSPSCTTTPTHCLLLSPLIIFIFL